MAIKSAKLPISEMLYQNVDDISLVNLDSRLYNVYIDETKTIVTRPGLNLFQDLGLGKSVDGLYWFEAKGCIIAVCGGHIFKVTQSSFSKLTSSPMLVSGNPVTFDSTGKHVFIANGGKIVITDGSTVSYVGDADAPTTVSHVGYLDTYILCNQMRTGYFNWSEVLTNGLDWNALNFAQAEGNPDWIRALHIGWREIYLFGSKTIEVWYNDGSSPFSRLGGAFIERGVGAIYSIRKIDNGFNFLDHERRIVRLVGRQVTVISTAFDKVIQNMKVTSDAIGSQLISGGREFYLLTFPEEGRTFALDTSTQKMYEWNYWNNYKGQYEPFLCQTQAYAPEWNKYLMGSRMDGKIYTVSPNYTTDNGDIIRTVIRTGWTDGGNLGLKILNFINIKIKSGVPWTGDTPPQIMVRWRDNGKSAWGKEHWISLNQTGQTEFIKTLQRLGQCRSRQWEFVLTDNIPLVLCEAELEYEELGG